MEICHHRREEESLSSVLFCACVSLMLTSKNRIVHNTRVLGRLSANILSRALTRTIGEARDIVSMWPPGPQWWMGRLPALGTQIREGKNMQPPPQELHNKIIITSMQPPLFSFHLSFNQHGLFITLQGLVPFIASSWVGSGGHPCCVTLRGC